MPLFNKTLENAEFAKQAKESKRRSLEALYAYAEQGDKDAKWVVQQLDSLAAAKN